MRKIRNLAAVVLIPVFMSGCATTNSGDWNMCVIGGAIAGAAAGVATDGEVVGALVGAGAGAILGQVMCGGETAKPAPTVKDSDGDGVPDGEDKCPGTPPDVSIYSNGCPYDSDGDGVADFLDLCPGTPKGARVNFNGCPFDSDKDGVFDGLDKCPGTPKGARVDAVGCSVAGESLAIVTNVNFDFDSSRIRSDSKGRLAQVINILKENPKLRVRIVGHTDSTGGEQYNLDLSLGRADAVRKYIVDRGVSITRLGVTGKGESQPLVPNKSRAGRGVNRRVEFEVVGK